MSVVLRCPNCGTMQHSGGECEACFEGEVQYFCTNHDEGVWLDRPVCSRCGAKFGDPPTRPAPVPTPRRTPVRPGGSPDLRPSAGRRSTERAEEPDFSARQRRRPDAEEPLEPEVLPRTPSLGELLEEITAAAARRRRRYEVDETPWATPRRRGPAFALSGCLVRILGLGFLLFLAFVLFLVALFGGFLVN